MPPFYSVNCLLPSSSQMPKKNSCARVLLQTLGLYFDYRCDTRVTEYLPFFSHVCLPFCYNFLRVPGEHITWVFAI